MLDQIIEIATLPFMQRALIGGILTAGLTSWIGILVVLRRSSFFGDAIAHASLTGVALGLLFNVNPILAATIYAIFISFILPYLQKHSELPIDSLLGFLLPFSMAIGVILLAFIPGYQPELISFLFGSILAIGWTDIYIIASLVVVAAITMLVLKRKLIFASFDREHAKISGIKVEKIDILYHVLLATIIVAGIKLVGIVLVNALLVIPASTVRLFANSLKQMFVLTPILAIFTAVVGLVLYFLLNVPPGPSIAVMSGTMFLLGVFVKKIVA